MLKINIPDIEEWDEVNEVFIETKAYVLHLEHSLVSLSKWESKWCKPFLGKDPERTTEQILDYVKCMTLDKNVPDEVYDHLTDENIKTINEYIDAPMTATWFNERDEHKRPNRDIITAELIYYWMIASQIPFECQKWHLNRLLTLIRVCSIKNQQPKKMSNRDILKSNHSLNAARRAAINSKG